MRRGTIFVLLFGLAAALVIGISQFLRALPPLTITAAVHPLAEGWLRAAVGSFNDANVLINGSERIVVQLQTIDDVSVWRGSAPFSAQSHPTLWIPALDASIGYAVELRLPFERIAPSIAQTPLVWGAFERYAAAARGAAPQLDWPQVQAAASAQNWASIVGGDPAWGFVDLVFSPPTSALGLAALLSGAAAFQDRGDVSPNTLSGEDFRAWLRPVLASIPNFNTVGGDPAAVLARGPAAGEIALAAESQWLLNLSGIVSRQPFVLSYPAHPLIFTFPAALWSDSQTTDSEREAARRFAEWLLLPSQQAAAAQYGLRPALGPVAADAPLFAAAAAYGFQAQPAITSAVEPPTRDAILRLLSWIDTIR